MAGNKQSFDTAMKRAHELAWANQWDRALKEYDRALQEFPEDRTAQRNRAQCLFRLRNWSQALDAYDTLLKGDPGDLFALNRLAEIYLASAQNERAVIAYNHLADRYIEGGQYHEAIRALRDLTRAMPKLKIAHHRLLDLTTQVGDRQAQAEGHLAVSEIELDEGNLGEAQGHAEAAASLAPENPRVRSWMQTVRSRIAAGAGTQLLTNDGGAMKSRKGAIAPGTHMLNHNSSDPDEAMAILEQATAAQNRGEFKEALDLYDRAVRAGAKSATVFYNAGLLNQQMGRPDMAIPFLERALGDAEFAMSANYALGKCYTLLGDFRKAVPAFERALGLLNIPSLTRSDADELIELFTSAAEANLADRNPGRASSLYSNLARLFKEKRWQHPQVASLEKKADEMYNASIQSKLMGIGAGSSNLPDVQPASPPQIEGTRIMSEGEANDNTQALQLGTLIIPESADQSQPLASAGSESATAIMRNPGRSLRSITEYLRASNSEMPDDDAAGEEIPAEIEVLRHSAEEIIPTLSTGELAQLGGSSLQGVEEQSEEIQGLIADGEAAIASAKYDAAIDACLTVISLEPGYLPIHMMLGDIYLRQGKAEEAITKYQTVMDLYVAREDPENAAATCRRLLQLQPDNPSLQSRMGLLLLAAGKFEEAARALLVVAERHYNEGDLDRALQEAQNLKQELPDSAEVALALGTYQMLSGNTGEALAELSRALHIDPTRNVALARLYLVLAQSGDDTQWDALESSLERAQNDKAAGRTFMEELHSELERKPASSIYYGLAVLAERQELPEIAADSLDQGLLMLSLGDTEELTDSWLLLELLMCQSRADLALQAQDGAIAVQHYKRAINSLQAHGALLPVEGGGINTAIQSPRPQYSFARLADPAQLYYGLAEAHASQNNWEGAQEALQALKGLMPSDPSVYTRLADIYFRHGQLAEALQELNELLVMYQRQNDHEHTLETLGHMARLAPNNVAVRRKLSEMYLKLGMTDYGLTELNTLAELQIKAGMLKDAMRTYQKAAELHYTLGQHDRAIEIYEKVVRIGPRDTDARQQLINTYIMSGKMKEAVASERSLADMFVAEGRTEEAISALHQLLALAPEDVPGHHLLAKQLTTLGKYGEAARLYGRLTRLDPENDRVSLLQSEMQRMAKEAKEEEGEAEEAERAVPVGRQRKR